MSETPTPRTEALLTWIWSKPHDPSYFVPPKMIEHARQLERELSEYQAKHTAIMREADRRYDELLAHNQENAIALTQAQARCAEVEKALQEIANLALAPMVDMADPPEDQARDWAHVAELAWTIARKALKKPR